MLKKRVGKAMVRAATRVGFLSAYGSVRSRLVQRQVAILAYHRIDRLTSHPWSLTAITPEDFDFEMRYLRRRYHLVSLDELTTALGDSGTLPRNTAVVTIDDGYKDNYIHAYPILRKYDIPATVFLVTGHIGTGDLFWFDKVRYVIWKTEVIILELGELGTYRLASAESRRQAANAINARLKKLPVKNRDEFIERLMKLSGVDIPLNLGEELILSWDEVREMNRHGIDFSSHTVSHPILSQIPLDAAEKEILDSKRHIEQELDREVTTFCYPNGEPGDFNTGIEEILKRNGFKCALTFAPAGFVSTKSQLYRLPRIPGVIDPDIFELLMSGLYLDLVGAVKAGNRT
jgi:peptidoglycan/xylan/chitin deacetylase (PgdA/CDA1 family)